MKFSSRVDGLTRRKGSYACLSCGTVSESKGACGCPGDHSYLASRAEARRFRVLWTWQTVGVISGLECQPRFLLVVNGRKVGAYRADFRYVDDTGETVVEDVKSRGSDDALSKLKRRLTLALHNVDVKLVE